jgi:hypothetical protein
MPNESNEQADKEYTLFMRERDGLIDAAREFDKAVLTFGSAVFGASIAFIKDVAPKPNPCSLMWLLGSWALFSLGLLTIMLSFLFSQKACMFEIDIGAKTLKNPNYERPNNYWSMLNDWCNYLCVCFLFAGLLSWSLFAFQNLATGGAK